MISMMTPAEDSASATTSSVFVQRMLGRVRRRDGQSPSSVSDLSTIWRQTEPMVVTNNPDNLVEWLVFDALRYDPAAGEFAVILNGQTTLTAVRLQLRPDRPTRVCLRQRRRCVGRLDVEGAPAIAAHNRPPARGIGPVGRARARRGARVDQRPPRRAVRLDHAERRFRPAQGDPLARPRQTLDLHARRLARTSHGREQLAPQFAMAVRAAGQHQGVAVGHSP